VAFEATAIQGNSKTSELPEVGTPYCLKEASKQSAKLSPLKRKQHPASGLNYTSELGRCMTTEKTWPWARWRNFRMLHNIHQMSAAKPVVRNPSLGIPSLTAFYQLSPRSQGKIQTNMSTPGLFAHTSLPGTIRYNCTSLWYVHQMYYQSRRQRQPIQLNLAAVTTGILQVESAPGLLAIIIGNCE
jgi:hypothetical protein